MSEGPGAELSRIVDAMAKDGQPPESGSLDRVAEEVARIFHVKPDEVAILTVNEKDKHLRFILPEKLQTIGTIPTSSTGALAARTVRDNRAEAINTFSSTRHASVFEGVPMGRHGQIIQKIMSAPILAEGKVIGVVQISRKGRNAIEAGPDFGPKDLRELTALSAVLARFIRLFLPA